MNKKIFKSIGAVLAGFISVFILSVITDAILEKIGFFPPQSQLHVWWLLLIALIYRTIYTIIGGYVTASLAPAHPMRHAIILGVLGLIFGTLGVIANLDKSTPATIWYPIMIVVLSLPSVWLGGKLRTK
ncbi:MAG TPA: hypothetical protein VLG12_01360 [Candidatus Saccharimonadales bacterium]|nr:hypothetical protein [Candidatus Saccharimonadales bacterium]